MRNLNEIVADLKHNIEWSQPNMRYNNLMELVTELEQALTPKVTTQPETLVEEAIVEEILPETIVTGSIEDEETVTPKKGRKPSTNA
jgi:hypothetical protein